MANRVNGDAKNGETMLKRNRDYFEAFEDYQRLCQEYDIGSPPPHKKFKTNNTNNSNLPKLTEPQILFTTERSLQIQLNHSSDNQNKNIAKETINILTNGHYKTNSNKLINIKKPHNNSFEKTILYHHNNDIGQYNFQEIQKQNKFSKMHIEIVNETTLNGCYSFCSDPAINNPVALNFASAQSPGGSFKNGGKAQEESLCRCSSLYGTLIKYKNEFYKYHKNLTDKKVKMLYSDSMIYSPNVPIFRDHNNNLLDDYYLCSFISSPAVNCKEFMKRNSNQKYNVSEKIVHDTMKQRIAKILDIAVKHKHDAVILGAFGCGKFGNDINSIADIFAMLLATKYAFCFKKVRFSCLEMGKECHLVETFQACMNKWFKVCCRFSVNNPQQRFVTFV